MLVLQPKRGTYDFYRQTRKRKRSAGSFSVARRWRFFLPERRHHGRQASAHPLRASLGRRHAPQRPQPTRERQVARTRRHRLARHGRCRLGVFDLAEYRDRLSRAPCMGLRLASRCGHCHRMGVQKSRPCCQTRQQPGHRLRSGHTPHPYAHGRPHLRLLHAHAPNGRIGRSRGSRGADRRDHRQQHLEPRPPQKA